MGKFGNILIKLIITKIDDIIYIIIILCGLFLFSLYYICDKFINFTIVINNK